MIDKKLYIKILLIAGCLLLMIGGKELVEVEYEGYDPRYKNLNENAMKFLVLMSISAIFSWNH